MEINVNDKTYQVMDYLISKLESRYKNIHKYVGLINSVNSYDSFIYQKNNILSLFNELEKDLLQASVAIKALLVQKTKLSNEINMNKIQTNNFCDKLNELLNINNLMNINDERYQKLQQKNFTNSDDEFFQFENYKAVIQNKKAQKNKLKEIIRQHLKKNNTFNGIETKFEGNRTFNKNNKKFDFSDYEKDVKNKRRSNSKKNSKSPPIWRY